MHNPSHTDATEEEDTDNEDWRQCRLISLTYARHYQAIFESFQIDSLQTVFTQQSNHPDKRLRSLLNRVLKSSFIRDNELEPTQESIEGLLIMGDGFVDHASSSTHSPAPRGSIYLHFISGRTCLFCGSTKGSISRALGCVRYHLYHRPFHCPLGRFGDCNRCHGRYVFMLNNAFSSFGPLN
jgi:hypothetical protein